MTTSDRSLRHTIHRTGTELLHVPIADEPRGQLKGIIDSMGHRGGQAIASLAILAVGIAPHSRTILSAILIVLALLWIGIALGLRRHYLDLFRSILRQRTVRTHVNMPELDVGSLETLIAALNSREDAEVTSALDILASQDKTHLIPALILYHPSEAVVLRALDLFQEAGRRDYMPVADRLLAHPSDEIRAAAMQAHASATPSVSLLRNALGDPSPAVRAIAFAGLMLHAPHSRDEAQLALEHVADQGPVEAQLALARAIRIRPVPQFESLLVRLAGAEDPAVRAEVARAMAESGSAAFLGVLLPMLAQRSVRNAARQALVASGQAGLAFLERAMTDRSLPHAVRRHIPRTVSRFEPGPAAALLTRRLRLERDETIQYKVLRGLERLRADAPGLRLDAGILREVVAARLADAYRCLDWRISLEACLEQVPLRRAAPMDLLLDLLRAREVQGREKVLRLLGLLHGRENFERIRRGMTSSNPKVRDSSRELLEHALRPPLRQAVIGLNSDESEAKRLAMGSSFHSPQRASYEDILQSIMTEGSEELCCMAAYYIGEQGLGELEPALVALRASPSPFVVEIAERALGILHREPAASVRRLQHA